MKQASHIKSIIVDARNWTQPQGNSVTAVQITSWWQTFIVVPDVPRGAVVSHYRLAQTVLIVKQKVQ